MARTNSNQSSSTSSSSPSVLSSPTPSPTQSSEPSTVSSASSTSSRSSSSSVVTVALATDCQSRERVETVCKRINPESIIKVDIPPFQRHVDVSIPGEEGTKEISAHVTTVRLPIVTVVGRLFGNYKQIWVIEGFNRGLPATAMT
ncbi:hypothetical protein QBC38DRAFT_445522 [Podospora fimiseda]|uniref:Uncharacterized protein n=1 Tax=Podospora fimiseda TaxID=252190 RepID=A0AAN7BLC8_9PEZI|nr:hypothetical protein QBC38DRAFT_445522 [Podospora fimiseda]